MPIYGDKFVYGEVNLSEQQQRVALIRAAAAKRERELVRRWAARRPKKTQRREGERLPKELLGSRHSLAQQDPFSEEVDTCSSTSGLVQPKEVVRRHNAPLEERNLPNMEDTFPSEDGNFSFPGKKGKNSPGTPCTTTLLLTVPRWVLRPPEMFFPARGGVLLLRQHGHHVVWRRRGQELYLERSISWLRFFYFAGRRREMVEASVSHTLLEARWHTLLSRTVAVTLQECVGQEGTSV